MPVNGLRLSSLPLEHLEAELLAAPFCSYEAFSNSLILLDDKMTARTGLLWREQERNLLSRFPGISIDELVYRRDRIWFQTSTESDSCSCNLLTFLRRAVKDLLQPKLNGNGLQEDDRSIRRRWRWVTFALPEDLLLTALDTSISFDFLQSRGIRTSLSDKGFAESHLHLKASMDFPMLWTSLLSSISRGDANPSMFASPGADFNEGKDLAEWVIKSVLCRYALGSFLSSERFQRMRFSKYINDIVLDNVQKYSGSMLKSTYKLILNEVMTGQKSFYSPAFTTLKHLLMSLNAKPANRSAKFIDDIATLDPLYHLFPTTNNMQPESAYCASAFNYLSSNLGCKDQLFAKVFWQTQRIKVFFYRHIVQRPMTPGLQWFTRTYSRLSSARKAIGTGAFLLKAARLAGDGLRSLEVRIVPERSMADLLKMVTEIDHAAKKLNTTEVGIVFHFSRTRGPDAENGYPKAWAKASNEDPGAKENNPTRFRYSGYYIDRREEAVALASLLCKYPRMLERVRGLDLCTDELGVPLWVMLPLLQHVRRAGDIAKQTLSKTKYPVPGLRLTVHAGEDFVHLLGSLRRIGEIMEYLPLKEGDRIGHGVALGIDVKSWAHRSTGLAIPCGERLLDLIWSWQAVMRCNDDTLRSFLPLIERDALRLSSFIFKEHHCMNELAEWQIALHSTKELSYAGFPERQSKHSNNNARKLLLAWLQNTQVFRRSQVLEPIDITNEIALIEGLQQYVKRWLAREGIAIEINPSSNLLIGHLGDLTNHPLWRLCPPSASEHQKGAVRVCIGSDDPITFATSLPQEYELLADAMIEGGLSMPEVDAWLENARSTGMALRFTVPQSGKSLTSELNYKRMPVTL